MISRIRARNEWKFFGVLLAADRTLAITWWTLLILRGLLPAVFAVAMGWTVDIIQHGGDRTTALAVIGVVFVSLQVLPPLHRATGANLGNRTAAWLYDQLTVACIQPAGMGHLENPKLTSDLTMSRDFDLAITGPPLYISMGFLYGGFGVVAAFSVKAVKALAPHFDYHQLLLIIGLVMFVAWPISFFLLKDKPSDIGQFPDGDTGPPAEQKIEAKTIKYLMSQWSFWLLLIGSLCSIGAIGAVNVHMKLVFKDAGFPSQLALDNLWYDAQFAILCSSIVGRLLVGKLSDVLPMKYVMTATYFFVAASIPLLLSVTSTTNPYYFAIVFGFAMGADYMLIPLMAAKQFGVNSLSRAMAVILPVNTIGQTWVPYGVSMLRDNLGSYAVAMNVVLGLAVVGAIAIAMLPRDGAEQDAIAGKVAPQATRA